MLISNFFQLQLSSFKSNSVRLTYFYQTLAEYVVKYSVVIARGTSWTGLELSSGVEVAAAMRRVVVLVCLLYCPRLISGNITLKLLVVAQCWDQPSDYTRS